MAASCTAAAAFCYTDVAWSIYVVCVSVCWAKMAEPILIKLVWGSVASCCKGVNHVCTGQIPQDCDGRGTLRGFRPFEKHWNFVTCAECRKEITDSPIPV